MQAGTAADFDNPPILARRLSRRRRILLDGVLVLVYAATLLVAGPTGVSSSAPPSSDPAPWERLVLIAATAAPVAARRIKPLPVFVVVLAATAVAVMRDEAWDPFLPAACALYTVAVTVPLNRWWQRWLPGLAIAVLTAAGVVAAIRTGGGDHWRNGPGLLLLGFVALLGAWQLGRAARMRRAFAARAAEQLAQRAVTEERLRIARELHDVVTHSMGLIAVKAGVANHVLHVRPQEAHDALRVIEHTSRTALNDMRRMLGVLRTPEDARQAADLGPAPGTAALRELVRQADAQLTTRGVEGVPDAVALTVYRIVQEALTNVAKHAGPATRCQVVVDANGHEVRLDIVGMRERVALHGGTLTAGPRPEGGFTIHAFLPYEYNFDYDYDYKEDA
ncbi:sensor histidine kinase [Embleya sp. AB8]|uniref:sensor histidine kinase n=1 Tax=Embleya sp. AB8 TaxID=3156304 RepID=UPI003C73EEB4